MKIIVRFFTLLRKDFIASFSFLVLIGWIFVALLPFFIPYLHITSIQPELSLQLKPPNKDWMLGTDFQGISVAILLINGASTSLIVSFITVSFCLFIGIPLGAMAGFFGGWIDMVISRIMDVLLAFPPLIIPITMIAYFGGGFWNVIFALSLTGWVSYARLVRGQFLSLREREFVIAADSMGASYSRLMFIHILPNSLSPLAVQATFALAGVIISEAGLSFLGLGVGGSYTSWGAMLKDGKTFLSIHPYLIFIPSLALLSLVTSLNFIGEALRKAFDPKSLGSNTIA